MAGVETWEYARLDVSPTGECTLWWVDDAPEASDEDAFYLVNVLGGDGWELVGFQITSQDAEIYVFKRPTDG